MEIPKNLIEKRIGDYIILNQQLGHGAQAVCKVAVKNNNYQEVYAVKILDKSELKENMDHQKRLQHLKSEVDSLSKLNNLNIVKIIEIIESKKHIHLFLEYCNQGNLAQWAQKRGGALSESEVKMLMQQFKSAFEAMYEKNVIHRDIKPQNVLIHNGKIKIGDFGFAKTVDDMDKMEPRTFIGTPWYLPIELFNGTAYSSKCDVFSLGVTLFVLLYNKHPYYSKYKITSKTEMKNILKKQEIIIPDQPVIKNKFLLPLLIS